MKTLLVYGKMKTESRFKPFDMKDNKFVVNLIHASMFTEASKSALYKEVEDMNRLNPEYIFEVRIK